MDHIFAVLLSHFSSTAARYVPGLVQQGAGARREDGLTRTADSLRHRGVWIADVEGAALSFRRRGTLWLIAEQREGNSSTILVRTFNKGFIHDRLYF